MTHPMAADAYGSTLGSLKLRSSPTRSMSAGAASGPIAPRMSSAASPPTTLCSVTLARRPGRFP